MSSLCLSSGQSPRHSEPRFEVMLGFLCQSLFGNTRCKPAESQLLGEKETEAAGKCKETQAGVHERSAHSSERTESSSSNVTPKKTTVLIMVAPPKDFQQVG